MSIPESQLETWSHQGSITQSASTYNIIKNALEDKNSSYHGRNYTVFLQGSYGNDTNIYAESDVDIVIKLDDVYYSDLKNLSPEDKQAYNQAFIPATYSYDTYKQDVLNTLIAHFGVDVTVGDKAIAITANGSRRKTDVIAAMQFRRYLKFKSHNDAIYEEGICFFNSAGNIVANYPKQHSKNLTHRHQESGNRLKPMVRILKNLRGRLVNEKIISQKTAPSYFLEGLLYNLPVEKFESSYSETFINTMNWLQTEADKSRLVCANEQYYLLWEGVSTSWEKKDADAFISSAIELWNNW